VRRNRLATRCKRQRTTEQKGEEELHLCAYAHPCPKVTGG
jgi:hypothetical protein